MTHCTTPTAPSFLPESRPCRPLLLAALALLLLLVSTGCELEPWTGSAPGAEARSCANYQSPILPAPATAYHVDVDHSDASDANPGTEDRPWRTLAHAAGALAAGEVAWVHGGRYHEAGITFARSGEEGAPIRMAAWGDGEVVVEGEGLDAVAGIAIVADHVVVEGLSIAGMSIGIGTELRGRTEALRGVVLRDLEVFRSAEEGVHLEAVRDFVVERVATHDNGRDGLQVLADRADELAYSSHGWIVGVSAFNNGVDGTREGAGHGVAINQGHSIAVCDSVAHDNTSHGFDVSDWPKGGAVSQDVSFEGNRAWGQTSQAGFSVNSDSLNVRFVRNIAHDNEVGFYCYLGCGGTWWVNNTSARNKHGFQVEDAAATFVDTGARDLHFHNNLSIANRLEGDDARYPALEVADPSYRVSATHNDLVPADGEELAAQVGSTAYTPGDVGKLGEGNVSVDPEFEDLEGRDFGLRASSPAIDAGVVVQGDGFEDGGWLGSAPDLGAMESGAND